MGTPSLDKMCFLIALSKSRIRTFHIPIRLYWKSQKVGEQIYNTSPKGSARMRYDVGRFDSFACCIFDSRQFVCCVFMFVGFLKICVEPRSCACISLALSLYLAVTNKTHRTSHEMCTLCFCRIEIFIKPQQPKSSADPFAFKIISFCILSGERASERASERILGESSRKCYVVQLKTSSQNGRSNDREREYATHRIGGYHLIVEATACISLKFDRMFREQ